MRVRAYVRNDCGGIENLSSEWKKKNCALKALVRRKEECLSRPACSTYKEVISPGVEFPSRSRRSSLFLSFAVRRIPCSAAIIAPPPHFGSRAPLSCEEKTNLT